MHTKHYGFIGFGLIGGSIARAMKAFPEPPFLTAYQYAEKPSRSLTLALADQVLDSTTCQLAGLADCDMIFLCAPVQKNIDYLEQLKGILSPRCLLTDVGSVKGTIHRRVEELGLSARFIGGHPMTGSEKTGYEHSSALLMENAYYILTPTKDTPESALQEYSALVEHLGSIPVILDVNEHDRITAAISHVPHIIAAQLVNLVRVSGSLEPKMRQLAAGGFKDITRIASSSPEIWQHICSANKESICEVLSNYRDMLGDVLNLLQADDAGQLYHIFETAGTYRSSIPSRSDGILASVFELFVDIRDETGAIASLATLLSCHGVSIKNIGIVHNREFEQGVLHVEFYDADSKTKAKQVLENNRYLVYLR